jgi:magnesium transporter
MKTLTVAATVLISIQVITGIYGMNFRYMPELHWRWGYPAALGVMALISGALLYYFKRIRWL